MSQTTSNYTFIIIPAELSFEYIIYIYGFLTVIGSLVFTHMCCRSTPKSNSVTDAIKHITPRISRSDSPCMGSCGDINSMHTPISPISSISPIDSMNNIAYEGSTSRSSSIIYSHSPERMFMTQNDSDRDSDDENIQSIGSWHDINNSITWN